ncbi:MAG: DegT/DnrJ/EryC1/StrS family aminotransferase [Deltaproteobacteria bacterium]|nr:DegT/DnrJ/EryC1/StrS family aminotransferase [Deltaproteobacteria bacterium]
MSVIPHPSARPFNRIPVTRPVFDLSEEEAVLEVLRSGWLVQGPKVAQFEGLFKEFVGASHAVATTSCTTALHLALLAAGIGPGDEVLLPAFTFIATANAVEYTGARPVFIDIDLDTYTIDPEKIREYLMHRAEAQTRPKCIIPVSLFGLCADMEAVNKTASEYGLIVVEDAACGFGAKRRGHHAGTEALAGCFSFHPRKAITTGEGGMVITNDDRLADTIRKLRDHGASKTDRQRHLEQGGSLLPEYEVLGYNFRMTDLQGALGATQMKKAEMILQGRKQAAARYDELLGDFSEIKRPHVPHGFEHGFQSYVCLYKAASGRREGKTSIDWDEVSAANLRRNRLMTSLERMGASLRQGTHALHTLGFYKRKYGLKNQNYPMAYLADRLSFTLPLYYGITEDEQFEVIENLRRVMDQVA